MKVRPVKRGEGPERIIISTEFIKLDSFLKLSGAVSTGGEAKLAIQSGSVTVNSERCEMRGRKLRPGDIVAYGGKVYLTSGPET